MMRLALAALLNTATAMDTSADPGPDLTVLAPVKPVHLRQMDDSGRFGHLHSTKRTGEDVTVIAKDALAHAGLAPEEWFVISNYMTKKTGLNHVSLRQHVGGLECVNCIAVCNVDRHGRVVNLGYTAHTGRRLASTTPTITPRQALEHAVAYWNASVPEETQAHECDPVKEDGCEQRQKWHPIKGLSPFDTLAKLEVLATGHDEAALVWQISIETEDPYYHMYEVSVQATGEHAGAILQLHDLVNWDNWGKSEANLTATALRGEDSRHVLKKQPLVAPVKPGPKKRIGGVYEIYPIPFLDPTLGPRGISDDDIDFRASPLGWHDTGEVIGDFTDTQGNNVCAQENRGNSASRSCNDDIGARPDGGDDLNFVFEFDEAADPTADPTQSAAITNLFWWHNVFHDITYLNGFDEPAGNFQENNFELGGLGDDGVQANAQDGAGFNNANFATPVDGQRPRCRMYLWNAWTPFRDGDFDSGIIVHEVGHGVSNRLTGGPNQAGCLPGGQAGGMGEGWSDWWAIQLMQRDDHGPNTAFPMGDYVVTGGIRIYPYSYDMEINPATYGFISGPAYSGVHAMGSFWCGALHDVYWLMRIEYGWDPNWYDGVAGNNMFWQNVLDGNKLQPCQPNMVDARDAILLADEQNYGGVHVCTLWCGFARRGMGVSAFSGPFNNRNVEEAFDFPTACDCPELYAKADAAMALHRANATISL